MRVLRIRIAFHCFPVVSNKWISIKLQCTCVGFFLTKGSSRVNRFLVIHPLDSFNSRVIFALAWKYPFGICSHETKLTKNKQTNKNKTQFLAPAACLLGLLYVFWRLFSTIQHLQEKLCGSMKMRLDLMQACDAPWRPSKPWDGVWGPSEPWDVTRSHSNPFDGPCGLSSPADRPCSHSNPLTDPTAGSGDCPVAFPVTDTHKMKEWMHKSSRLVREESPTEKGKEQ